MNEYFSSKRYIITNLLNGKRKLNDKLDMMAYYSQYLHSLYFFKPQLPFAFNNNKNSIRKNEIHSLCSTM